MKTTIKLTTWGLLATLAAASVTPALADGYQSRSQIQTNKNTMRNLAIGGAAVAAYGLFNHNSAATLLGAAGAALAGSQYEKDRRQQSQDNGYYYRDGRGGNGSDRYHGDRYNGGYDRGQYNNSRYGTDRDSDSRYDNNGNDGRNAWFHHDNRQR